MMLCAQSVIYSIKNIYLFAIWSLSTFLEARFIYYIDVGGSRSTD